MGALDDAIREHLELKRQHGASDDELRRAEAEALGPARRAPGGVDPVEYDDVYEQPDAPPIASEAVEDAPPPPPEDEGGGYTAAPEAVEPYGMEPEAVAPEPEAIEPEPEAIAPEPEAIEPEPEPEPTAPYATPPVEPDPGATQAFSLPPLEPEPAAEPEPHVPYAPPPVDDAHDELPKDDDEVAAYGPGDHPDDPDRVRTTILDDPLGMQPPVHHEPGPDEPPAPARPDHAAQAQPQPPAPLAPGGDEDVLEETPDFLQETPEHDRLWFEQKPPRDFDFDD